MERVPWKRGSCYLVQVDYCHLGTGYYVISLFGFSKEARNSDFYVSSPKFFSVGSNWCFFVTLQDSMAYFFSGDIDIRSILTDSFGGNKKSTCQCEYWRGKRFRERGEWGTCSAMCKDNKYRCFIFYQNIYIPTNWVLKMSKTCMIARNLQF